MFKVEGLFVLLLGRDVGSGVAVGVGFGLGIVLSPLLAKFMPYRITPPRITPMMIAIDTSFLIVFRERIAV